MRYRLSEVIAGAFLTRSINEAINSGALPAALFPHRTNLAESGRVVISCSRVLLIEALFIVSHECIPLVGSELDHVCSWRNQVVVNVSSTNIHSGRFVTALETSDAEAVATEQQRHRICNELRFLRPFSGDNCPIGSRFLVCCTFVFLSTD